MNKEFSLPHAQIKNTDGIDIVQWYQPPGRLSNTMPLSDRNTLMPSIVAVTTLNCRMIERKWKCVLRVTPQCDMGVRAPPSRCVDVGAEGARLQGPPAIVRGYVERIVFRSSTRMPTVSMKRCWGRRALRVELRRKHWPCRMW